MNLPYAYRIAASYDFNRDGIIRHWGFNKELDFDWQARQRTDTNRDGRITVDEFAHALARGDVFIGYDREVHASTPFVGPNPGYPYPGGGSPFYPGYPNGPVTYPGSGWGWGAGYGYGSAGGDILAGAVVGGAVGYVTGGKDGLGTGAVVGGFIGALGSLFK
jgi:hypothetical protein